MKTKTSILTALIALASGAGAMAQVYSQNVVGYVTTNLPNGFSLISNPLNSGNNTVATVFAGAPLVDGSVLYKFNSGTGSYSINVYDFGEWSLPTQSFAPGEGAFFLNAGSSVAVTFTGEVAIGNLTNAIPSGFSIRSSQVPQAGRLDTVLGFPAVDGDIVYKWKNNTGSYSIHSYDFGEWNINPDIAVGEAFFVAKAGSANWTRTFNPNN